MLKIKAIFSEGKNIHKFQIVDNTQSHLQVSQTTNTCVPLLYFYLHFVAFETNISNFWKIYQHIKYPTLLKFSEALLKLGFYSGFSLHNITLQYNFRITVLLQNDSLMLSCWPTLSKLINFGIKWISIVTLIFHSIIPLVDILIVSTLHKQGFY